MRDLITIITEGRQPVEAFINDVKALGTPYEGNFINVDGAYIDVRPFGPSEANLMEIRTHLSGRKQGKAGALLKAVCKLADRHGITVYGNAYPIRRSLHDRHMNQDELTAWYVRHGFEVSPEPAMRGVNIVRYPGE
jgi:hypothetical protein